MSKNELVQKSYKGTFCRKYLCLYTVPQGTTDKFFDFVGFIMSYHGLCVASSFSFVMHVINKAALEHCIGQAWFDENGGSG